MQLLWTVVTYLLKIVEHEIELHDVLIVEFACSRFNKYLAI